MKVKMVTISLQVIKNDMIKQKWYSVVALLVMFLSCKENKEVTYFDSGDVQFSVALKNSERHGKSITYYENGNVKLVSHWVRGEKSGPSTSFFLNGQINMETTYSNGKVNGKVTIYDSLGNLKEVYNVKDDLKEGSFYEYFKNGAVRVEGNYSKDKPDGPGSEYYENGKLFRKYVYKGGDLIYFKGYSKSGELYDSKLPIHITETKDSKEVEIRLAYTEFDRARVGIIIGNLDSENHLIDTLSVHGSKGLSVAYRLGNGQSNITGILYEIEMPNEQIRGEYFFRYELN